MLGWVEFPPEGFAETFRLTAHALQIIEIGGWYLLKHGAKVRHRHRREAVGDAGVVQMAQEEAHQLAAFGKPFPAFGRRSRLL